MEAVISRDESDVFAREMGVTKRLRKSKQHFSDIICSATKLSLRSQQMVIQNVQLHPLVQNLKGFRSERQV